MVSQIVSRHSVTCTHDSPVSWRGSMDHCSLWVSCVPLHAWTHLAWLSTHLLKGTLVRWKVSGRWRERICAESRLGLAWELLSKYPGVCLLAYTVRSCVVWREQLRGLKHGGGSMRSSSVECQSRCHRHFSGDRGASADVWPSSLFSFAFPRDWWCAALFSVLVCRRYLWFAEGCVWIFTFFSWVVGSLFRFWSLPGYFARESFF